MLTRLALLKSAIMGAMSSIGYPDYFRPRDFLSGLEGQQVYANRNFTSPSGTYNLYNVPAGKTLAVRLLGNSVAAHTAAGAAAPGLARSIIQIANGLDGASGLIYISWVEVILHMGQGDHDTLVIAEPFTIKGGAGGNQISVSCALTNLDSWDGLAYILGALLN